MSTANAARRQQPPEGMQPSGWLPTREFAKLWLAFVTQRWTPLPSGLDRTRGDVTNWRIGSHHDGTANTSDRLQAFMKWILSVSSKPATLLLPGCCDALFIRTP